MVISLTIIQSNDQVVNQIPRSVSISANIPSTIFYTLDETDPTEYSTIYTSPILLPTNRISVTLKVFATNGIDYSPIITETWTSPSIPQSQDARLSHSATNIAPTDNVGVLHPFGTTPIQPTGRFLNPSLAGENADNTILTPGKLPSNTTIERPVPIPEETEAYTETFDPRAYVIFMDATKADSTDALQVNRMSMSLENVNLVRDGDKLFSTSLETPPPSGGFVRSTYNPNDNTMTSYFYDSLANRWIIAKAPYAPQQKDGNIGFFTTLSSKENKPGNRFVFEWIPYPRRVLF